jgi:hypothetical protein
MTNAGKMARSCPLSLSPDVTCQTRTLGALGAACSAADQDARRAPEPAPDGAPAPSSDATRGERRHRPYSRPEDIHSLRTSIVRYRPRTSCEVTSRLGRLRAQPPRRPRVPHPDDAVRRLVERRITRWFEAS